MRRRPRLYHKFTLVVIRAVAQLWIVSRSSHMSAAFHPTPIPWSQFPVECFWYLAPMSVVHLVAFLVGCIVLVLLPRKQPGMLLRRIGRFGLFISLLLVVGSLFNGLWSCLVWERLYYSTDYLFDFVPFWPISQSMINRDRKSVV